MSFQAKGAAPRKVAQDRQKLLHVVGGKEAERKGGRERENGEGRNHTDSAITCNVFFLFSLYFFPYSLSAQSSDA